MPLLSEESCRRKAFLHSFAPVERIEIPPTKHPVGCFGRQTAVLDQLDQLPLDNDRSYRQLADDKKPLGHYVPAGMLHQLLRARPNAFDRMLYKIRHYLEAVEARQAKSKKRDGMIPSSAELLRSGDGVRCLRPVRRHYAERNAFVPCEQLAEAERAGGSERRARRGGCARTRSRHP